MIGTIVVGVLAGLGIVAVAAIILFGLLCLGCVGMQGQKDNEY